MGAWWSRFRAWATGRRGLSEELADEMESHLEMEAERYRDRGMSPDEARAAARRTFGNTACVAERSHEAWGFPSLDSLFKDVRYGLRAIRRAPAFSLVVIL